MEIGLVFCSLQSKDVKLEKRKVKDGPVKLAWLIFVGSVINTSDIIKC
jgi:hypothetical protein